MNGLGPEAERQMGLINYGGLGPEFQRRLKRSLSYNWLNDPNAPWNRLRDYSELENWRREAEKELMRRYLETLGYQAEQLKRGVGSRWADTGALSLGITSSIPTEWYNRGYQNLNRELTQSILQPGLSDIATRYAQQRQAQEMEAQQMFYEAMREKARRDQANRMAWLKFLGTFATIPFLL